MQRLRRLIHEVHRRSLWQVLGIYAIGAWVAYEVILGLVSGGLLPPWFPRVAVGAFVLGLPFVLATAFVQEGLPGSEDGGGAADERPAAAADRGGQRGLFTWRNALVAGGVVVLAGGLFVARSALLAPDDTVPPPEEEESPAVAVLPFENLSADPEDEYFAAGVHDEILNQLFKISSLQVTSRTSVMSYKDEPPKSTREVAEELGVRYVLEGTVRRFGDRVRITGQLIDAATDLHVWSDAYDRDLTDLLEIQAEVATEIARALEAELTPAEVARIESRPTEDPDAYDAYLKGLDYSRSGYVAGREQREEEWRIAGDMYARAIELDPTFALARAALGFINLRLYWYGYDRTEERIRLARHQLEEALRLDPDLPQGHINQGYYQYWVERDYDEAIDRFRRGLEGLPGNTDVRSLVGFVYRRQGRLDEAVEELEDAVRQDPLNGNLAEELGNTLRGARRWEESARHLNRAIALAPDYPDAYLRKIDLLVSWTGGVEGARQVLAEARDHVPSRELLVTAVWIEILARDYGAALEQLDGYPDEMIDDQYDLYPEDLLRARVLELAGRPEEARRSYRAARRTLESLAQERPDQYRVHRALARTYAGLGLHDRAVASVERAREGLPLEVDRWAAPDLIEDHAYVLARAGRAREAVELLELLLENPSRNRVTVPLLQLSPRWDMLRDEPAFRELVGG